MSSVLGVWPRRNKVQNNRWNHNAKSRTIKKKYIFIFPSREPTTNFATLVFFNRLNRFWHLKRSDWLMSKPGILVTFPLRTSGARYYSPPLPPQPTLVTFPLRTSGARYFESPSLQPPRLSLIRSTINPKSPSLHRPSQPQISLSKD